MHMVVRGRVVDAKGRAAAGAKVYLGPDFASIPAAADKGDQWQRWSTAITGPKGEYSFTMEPEGRTHPDARAVFALHDGMASQRIVIDCREGPVAVPDLMLTSGIVGCVRVLWDDGSPASGASLEVILIESMPEGADARAGNYSLEGVSDEQGEMSFGPIRDLEYRRIAVRVSHPDGPTTFPWWDGQRVSPAPIEITLRRGRVVRGRLLTPDGQPAVGYGVAPWGGETGDPEMRRVVTTDANGQFEVKGVGSPTGAIAVYERAPGAKVDDVRRRVRGSPLLIHEVPAGSNNLETVSIPRSGTLTLRLEDARGEPVHSGSGFWMRSKVRHGGVGVRVKQSGILRLEQVPLGIAITLHLRFDDAHLGELEQVFEIREVREETIVLRVNGAGTVIFRLHPKGAPDKALTVSSVSFGEHEHHGAFLDEPLSELRWWTRPGFYQSLMVAAMGFRERRIENVTVRDDGPTFLDVELEPR